MSQHHHHDNKGHHHQEEQASEKSGWKPVHHDWRFYAAGVLILLALVAYLLSADLRLRPAAPVAPTTNATGN
jgi:hypothetical protein